MNRSDILLLGGVLGFLILLILFIWVFFGPLVALASAFILLTIYLVVARSGIRFVSE